MKTTIYVGETAETEREIEVEFEWEPVAWGETYEGDKAIDYIKSFAVTDLVRVDGRKPTQEEIDSLSKIIENSKSILETINENYERIQEAL